MCLRQRRMTRDTIRERFLWVLKTTLNRVTTRMRRSGHGPFSLIRHVGRTSGRTYETPVILGKAPEGFIAELTYGDNVNWVRNIPAADGCVVVHRRREYRVDHVEPCSAEKGLSGYGTPFRQVLNAAGRDQFLLLRTDNAQTAEYRRLLSSGQSPALRVRDRPRTVWRRALKPGEAGTSPTARGTRTPSLSPDLHSLNLY